MAGKQESNPYAEMTSEDFFRILCELVDEMPASHWLKTNGDVYSILSEELNNAVLERWEEEQE